MLTGASDCLILQVVTSCTDCTSVTDMETIKSKSLCPMSKQLTFDINPKKVLNRFHPVLNEDFINVSFFNEYNVC